MTCVSIFTDYIIFPSEMKEDLKAVNNILLVSLFARTLNFAGWYCSQQSRSQSLVARHKTTVSLDLYRSQLHISTYD